MRNMEVLREQWMWNREARSIWLWGFIASGVILAAILYPFQGAMGLAAGFLPFLLTCAIVGPMYSYVGRNDLPPVIVPLPMLVLEHPPGGAGESLAS